MQLFVKTQDISRDMNLCLDFQFTLNAQKILSPNVQALILLHIKRETYQTLICMYDHIGTLWHKVADKDGRLHNAIYVARQK